MGAKTGIFESTGAGKWTGVHGERQAWHEETWKVNPQVPVSGPVCTEVAKRRGGARK